MMSEPVQIPDWIHAIFGDGPWKCTMCRCELGHPGVCDPCAEKYERRQEDTHLVSCMESIPPRFRWASLRSELLPKRVRLHEEGPKGVQRLLAGGGMVVLSGGAGRGKTSLACAILREVAGSKSRSSWRCRFLSAVDLGVSRRDQGFGVPDAVGIGKGASVLLLDDLGQETNFDPVKEVLHYRHNHGPTIVTTFLGREGLARRYDGGTERRLLDGALWIDMGGAQ